MTPKQERISRATHGYYRKIIVPAVREYCGYESDAMAHHALIAGFYELHPESKLPSMSDMSQDEASRFLEYALRQAAEMSLVLPDPQKVK